MSPDESWVKWAVIAAGLVQAVAAVIQLAQGRRSVDRGASKPGIPVDIALRFGVLAVIVGGVLLPIVVAAEEADPDDKFLDFLGLATGMTSSGLACGAAVSAVGYIIKEDKTLGAILTHAFTAVAGILVLVWTFRIR